MLEEADLSLGVSMSMSMFELSRTIGLIVVSLHAAGFNVFAKSLIGATIQDGGKRERSDEPNNCYICKYITTFTYITNFSSPIES